MGIRGTIGELWSFGTVWAGQLVSAIGSGLSGFVLGIWVYQRTGSTTLYALSAVFGSLPSILILPFAGVLVNRWSRRRTMIYCNLASAACTLAVLLLLVTGRLQVWHTYINTTFLSVIGSFMGLVFSTTVTSLVPKKHYGRSSGMTYTAQAAAQILPPLIAGMLLTTVEIQGIVLIDFLSCFFAVGTLLLVKIPDPAGADAAMEKKPLLREAMFGWNYVKVRRGLLALMVYFATINFVVGLARILFFPMILNFTTAKGLGTIISISGLGFLLGGVTMSVWGGPKRRVPCMLAFGLLFGVFVTLTGVRPSAVLVTAAAFCMYFCIPLVNGCSQAIWLSKTPADVQGRVFAIRWVVGLSTTPLAYVLAGPLADRFFVPLVDNNAWLFKLVGEGAGRGIGLMFIVAGLLTAAVQLTAYLYPRLRRVEKEIPDAVNEVVVSGA
jgi:MFS family permease